jgi:hypothetical protein
MIGLPFIVLMILGIAIQARLFKKNRLTKDTCGMSAVTPLLPVFCDDFIRGPKLVFVPGSRDEQG